MRIYSSRDDEAYISELQQVLTPHLDKRIRDVALKIDRPFTTPHGVRLTHCFRVDFVGIAATRLFDIGKRSAPQHVYPELLGLCKRAGKMNKHGVFLRIRLLLQYPYTTSAIQRMQAEWSLNRSSIDEPRYVRDFNFVEHIDESLFSMSSFVATQATVLDQVQDLAAELGSIQAWDGDVPNKIILRFTPVHPNLCALFVNDAVYYDTYLFAKEERGTRRCPPTVAPLICLESAVDERAFHALEDHFRYLWELDVTLDAEDATHYKVGVKRSLAQVRPPRKVDYAHKARRIRKKNSQLTEGESLHWRTTARRVLERGFCGLATNPPGERVFISCGWSRDATGRASPNADARELAKLLDDDLGSGGDRKVTPPLMIDVLEAETGGILYTQLYESLNSATRTIVMLSNDMIAQDGTPRASPNVYHEAGYAMKQLGAQGVMLMCEVGAPVPTNIQELVHERYARGGIALAYHHVVRWLGESLGVAPAALADVLTRHASRLVRMADEGLLGKDAVAAVRGRIVEMAQLYRGRGAGTEVQAPVGGESADSEG